MRRHNATKESIAQLTEDRKRFSPEEKKPASGSMLTKEQVYSNLGSVTCSGMKIPRKLIPKVPKA